jgi:hypothetical protein
MQMRLTAPIFFLLSLLSGIVSASVRAQPVVLKRDTLARHIAFFNAMEPEGVINTVPNAQAEDWLHERIPLFECPDAELEETYYFRWWALRKQLRREGENFVFTEFITKPRPVSSALGHNLMEGRWLRDPAPINEHLRYWLRGHEGGPQPHLHKYSSWLQDAVYQRTLVTGDTAFVVDYFDDLVRDYRLWQQEKRLPSGLYWQHDVWDAMEESISGSRTAKNIRPTINSYMFGNARGIAALARLIGRAELAREYDAQAEQLRQLVLDQLWDTEAGFFKVRLESGPLADAREAIGFIPWYFGLVPPTGGYGRAWSQLIDPHGFSAPYGITTAERRHPAFRSHGVGTCEWDGAVWPYATSQTLTALARTMRENASEAGGVSAQDYFDAFITYTRSHRYDGLPYIGEYLDETTGQWLKGRNPRSFYYNHSTFADLLITGVIGLVPRADQVLEINPLLPVNTWAWFCLDNVRYRGHDVTILWDRDGTRYGRGAGLQVFADGKVIARADVITRVEGRLP